MTKKNYIRLSIFALCLILGAVFGIMSKVFEDKMPLSAFSKTLHYKENIAEKNLQAIKNQIVTTDNKTDFVNIIDCENFESQDIFYYVIVDSSLVYWSDNQLDGKDVARHVSTNLQNNTFVKLSNAYCLLKTDSIKNLKLLAAIKIKNIYGVNNRYVENNFAKGFLIDKNIEIDLLQQKNGAIYNLQGEYIFSLAETQDINHNKIYPYLFIFFAVLAFIFYGFLYYNIDGFFGVNTLNIKQYLLATLVFFALPLLLLTLKIPSIIFNHRIFNPLLYFGIMPSVGHLLIITLLAAFAIFTLYYKVSFEVKRKYLFFGIFQVVFPVFFLQIMRVIYNIIYNSTLDAFNFMPQSNKLYSVIALSIVVLLFLTFCFAYRKGIEIIQKFIPNRFIFYTNIICSLLLCVILFLFKSPHFLLFSVAYFVLISLIFLFVIVIKTSYSFIYLAIICYFISIFIVYHTLENQQDNQYKSAEVLADNLVLQEHETSSSFFNNISILHGYPNEIFDEKTNNFSPKFSSALYKKNKLICEFGTFSYPAKNNFKIENKKNNSVNLENHIHYIFIYDDDLQIIVSSKQMNIQNTFILNTTYIFSIFVIFLFLIRLIFKQKKSRKGKSITDNLQKSFIYIIVLALSIVVLSITYFIYSEYRKVQKRELETKMRYIASDFNKYFRQLHITHSKEDNSPLHFGDKLEKQQPLSDFTNALSLKYEIDIHLYSVDGELLTTSCPYIFTNGFLSNLINPEYFFEKSHTNTIKIENIGSLKYFSIYSALFDTDKNIAAYLAVPMLFSMEQLRSETILYIALVANIFFIILIGSILLNYWLSRRITQSISKVEESLKNIAVGEKNLKMDIVESEKMDEIEKLMLQYNIMVDELEKNTYILLENERNLAWRDMAKQIAHEIKNPLTPMKLSIQQLQRIKKIKPEKFDDYFAQMSPILIEQIDNLSKIASSFSNFAKIQTENFAKIDITQKLFSSVELFKNNAQNVEIIYERPPEPIFVKTDSEQILEVFNNILKNAIQAIPNNRKGKINVSAMCEGANVLIVVADNGCGIAVADRKRIFTPNFSTKSSGTGLGLSIAKHIIEVSNGKIWFNSRANRGTEFFIEFKIEK